MSLIFASMVRETSMTTGTGTYDLAGASDGYAGFVAGAGDAAVVGYRAQMDDDWEIGIGTVTDAATDTLARTEILQTLVSGVLDNTSPAAVSWGAGTKTIDLIGLAESLTKDSGFFLPHPGHPLDGLYMGTEDITLNVTIVNGHQMYYPYYHPRRSKIEIACQIATAQADRLIDLGLYDNVDGEPKNLLESSVGNSAAATGTLLFATTSIYNPGWYWISYISDGTTVQLRGNNNPAGLAALLCGVGSIVSGGAAYYRNQGSYASGLEDPATPNDDSHVLYVLYARPVS